MDPVTPLTATVDHEADGTAVIVLAGQLDLTTASIAEGAFASLDAAGSDGTGSNGTGSSSTRSNGTGPHGVASAIRSVVVDMTDLTFMDSTGITVLLMAVNRGHAVCLRNPSSLIRRLVAATGLSEILPVEP